MKKSALVKAIQDEIQWHNLSTFMSKEHKIVQTGCSSEAQLVHKRLKMG
jgi:hypothetical protein